MLAHPSTRYALAQRLRECRLAASLRAVDLAQMIGISQGQLSKIENGKRRIDPEQVRRWLEHTHANPAVIEELVEQARRADVEVTAWKERFASGWDSYQRSYQELERAATKILAYQVSVIHGLLQVPAYSQFIQREVVQLPEDQIAAGVSALTGRQRLLYEPGTQFSVILAEHVLRHRFAGVPATIEQLHRIAQVATLPTVDLAVIPVDTDMPLPYMTSFDLFQMPDDEPNIAVIELDTQEIRETDPDRVATLARRHQALRDAALTGQAAIDLVLRIAQEVTASIFPTNPHGQGSTR